MKHLLSLALLLPLAACATIKGPVGPVTVNPASVASNPSAWNGREVEVQGLLVWESGRQGLYQSYGAYCRGGEKLAIAVDWAKWAGVSQADNRRTIVVRGKFTNVYGAPQPGGASVIPSGAPGPGPLEPGSIVRWVSPPEPPCPKALP